MYKYYNLSLKIICPFCFYKGYPLKCDNGKLTLTSKCMHILQTIL